MAASKNSTELVPARRRVELDSRQIRRSGRSTQRRWQPPEGLSPAGVLAVIDAASSERDWLREPARTRSLPLAQRQAGWSRLQMAYLTIGDEEARKLMQEVAE
jgi:hypothetical protein